MALNIAGLLERNKSVRAQSTRFLPLFKLTSRIITNLTFFNPE